MTNQPSAQRKTLRLTRFGNPILREQTKKVLVCDIDTDETKNLIDDMFHTLRTKKHGIGLAAPQIGQSIAVAVIDIKPTKRRPKLPTIDMTIINPSYEGIGRKSSMWEGCMSSGSGENTLYAKAMRYKRITASWHDEHGKKHNEMLEGIVAHVFQHETDHLNGILFVDKVRDPKTYMLADEYKRRIVNRGKS